MKKSKYKPDAVMKGNMQNKFHFLKQCRSVENGAFSKPSWSPRKCNNQVSWDSAQKEMLYDWVFLYLWHK